MSIPLKSNQFAFNAQLKAFAADKKSRMTPKTATTAETTGPHVKLVQNALIDLGFHAGLSSTAREALFAELNAGRYGPSTAAVVQAFKSAPPKPILSPGQRAADNILDIPALDALDTRMQAKEAKERPVKPISADILIYLSGVQTPGGTLLDYKTPDTSGYLMRKPMKDIAARRPKAEFCAIGGSLVQKEMLAGYFLFRNFIEAERTNPPGRVVVYGYSAGANNALEYCRMLEAENLARAITKEPPFVIDMLITVDAAVRRDMPLGITRTVAGCVMQNINFFQTIPTPKWGSRARGGPNTPLTSLITGKTPFIENHNLDRELYLYNGGSPHAQVERASLSRCEKRIESCLKPVFFENATRR